MSFLNAEIDKPIGILCAMYCEIERESVSWSCLKWSVFGRSRRESLSGKPINMSFMSDKDCNGHYIVVSTVCHSYTIKYILGISQRILHNKVHFGNFSMDFSQ